MTKYQIILLLFSFTFVKAHTNVRFEKTYGNVNLISSTSYYTEEVNKNIITAEFVNLLLKELNYNKPILLILTQDRDFKCYAYFDDSDSENKGLNIRIFNNETNISKTLTLIENIISNKKTLNKEKDNFENWYNFKSSQLIKKILLNKINRPKDVPEIINSEFFDYYYENGLYHILSFQNNDVIEVAQVASILQFSAPTPNLLFIFTEKDALKIIAANYKYNFAEKIYHTTSETVNLKFLPECEYSFRPYSIKSLGQKYITIVSLFGDKVSLYNIAKQSMIQDLSTLIEN